MLYGAERFRITIETEKKKLARVEMDGLRRPMQDIKNRKNQKWKKKNQRNDENKGDCIRWH